MKCGSIRRPGKGRADKLTPLCLSHIGRGPGCACGAHACPTQKGLALSSVEEPTCCRLQVAQACPERSRRALLPVQTLSRPCREPCRKCSQIKARLAAEVMKRAVTQTLYLRQQTKRNQWGVTRFVAAVRAPARTGTFPRRDYPAVSALFQSPELSGTAILGYALFSSPALRLSLSS